MEDRRLFAAVPGTYTTSWLGNSVANGVDHVQQNITALTVTSDGTAYTNVYWDEGGYFIPAARDIFADGAFIPHSTLSNAHPPLVMAYLALAWKLFGFHIEVARSAMLLVSALTLLAVFRLAERVANRRVAAASVLSTALYPVFFAQSSLAHLAWPWPR